MSYSFSCVGFLASASLSLFILLSLTTIESQGYTLPAPNRGAKKVQNSLATAHLKNFPLNSRPYKAESDAASRTFKFGSSNNDDDDYQNDDGNKLNKYGLGMAPDELEWAATTLAYWPPVLLVIGLLAIPTTLVIIIAFIIPLIVPYKEEETRRSMRSLNNGFVDNGQGLGFGFASKPIELARSLVDGSSECIERISCELGSFSSQYQTNYSSNNNNSNSTSSFSNWIQEKLGSSPHLLNLFVSHGLKSRISRAFQHSTNFYSSKTGPESSFSSCSKFACNPFGGNNDETSSSSSSSNSNNNNNGIGENDDGNSFGEVFIRPSQRQRRSRRSTAMPEFDEDDSLWDRFVKYWGGRFIFVRKLQANKDVKFYPYLPSLG